MKLTLRRAAARYSLSSDAQRSATLMEFEDDDPAWLEACIAAVDSLPEANLPSASRAHRSDVNTPKFSSASSNDSFSITSTCHSLPSCPPVSSGSTSSRSFSKALDVGSIDGSLPSRQIGTSHESRDKMALKPLRHSSWTRGGPRRIHGIGINVRRLVLCAFCSIVCPRFRLLHTVGAASDDGS